MTEHVDASALPRRELGVRSRAGNAMGRTRAAVLDGAARAIEKHGSRRATMSDIASFAGVAKGTLYNHFRTKDAVYSAALDTGIRALAEECVVVGADDLAEALALAAERLSGIPALRRIATDEPAVLASLTSIGAGREWESVRQAVRATLIASGRTSTDAAVDVVLRWLVSFVGNPGRDVETQARLVAAAVPAAPVAATAAVAEDDSAVG
ncbi:MAG TPA: helix-turn-helix domain-containing protein [Mycobacteriales bacterium]|nr:helix-turn-helix domain-containing protein [Mycobacteriales bacterium]